MFISLLNSVHIRLFSEKVPLISYALMIYTVAHDENCTMVEALAVFIIWLWYDYFCAWVIHNKNFSCIKLPAEAHIMQGISREK